MPELPEVETIRSQLLHYLPFKVDSVSSTPQLMQNILHTRLSIKNKTIVAIKRKGKMLDFIMDDGSHLLSHLGMTGVWLVGESITATKHTHLTLKSEKYTLAYDDPRRFGHMYFYTAAQAEKKLAELGLDLTDPDLDLTYLRNVIEKYPNRMLKVHLMDQKLFAGTGNYITSEICARSKILPTRLCKDIKKSEYPKILKAIRIVVDGSLKSGGTTFQNYRDTTGGKGKGVEHLVVYGQKTCQMCKKTPVKKIILAQRGTFFCPHCQK